MKKLIPLLVIVVFVGCKKKAADWKCEYSVTSSGVSESRTVKYENKSKEEIKEIENLNNYDKNGVKSTMDCKRKIF